MFWNLNKKDLIKQLGEICDEHEIDIILLCEFDTEKCSVSSLKNYNQVDLVVKRKLAVFIKNTTQCAYEILTPADHFSPIYFTVRGGLDFILYLVHMPSDINASGPGRRETSMNNLARRIKTDSEKVRVKNQIVIGDFNSNPFDKELISSIGLNSINNENFMEDYRTISGEKIKVFYNPMWKNYADRNFPGTYYYKNTYGRINLYSHIFDQALFSHGLIEYLVDKRVNIVYNISKFDLLKEGKPNNELYSDHLPIWFEIMEEKNGN